MKINGERHYLWRALDHEGEVLKSFVTKTRNKASTLKFLKKVMKRYGPPRSIVMALSKERRMLRFRQMKSLQKFA